MIALLSDNHLPKRCPIDLINISFGSDKAPDRQTGLSALEELQSLRPERTWNFIKIDISIEELQEERINIIKHLIYPLDTVLDDSIGCAIWFAARAI